MSETNGTQQKEKATKVRRKPERESVLTPTFAASRQDTSGSLWDRNQQGSGLLQRQCACGTHIIGGGECDGCRRKREGGFLQRAAFTSVPGNAQPQGQSEFQYISPLRAGFNFSQIPAFSESSFVHDFPRIPLHSNARGSILPKLKVTSSGDTTSRQTAAIGQQQAGAQLKRIVKYVDDQFEPQASPISDAVIQRGSPKSFQNHDAQPGLSSSTPVQLDDERLADREEDVQFTETGTYREFETAVRRWVARRVLSRTRGAHRERTLVPAGSLRGYYNTIRPGQPITLHAHFHSNGYSFRQLTFSLHGEEIVINLDRDEPEPEQPDRPVQIPEQRRMCGPNITVELNELLESVRGQYDRWTPSQQRDACRSVVNPATAVMAWDIRQLWPAGPHQPPCSMPNRPFEGEETCSSTVEVFGQCYLAGTVNYALFGEICRLCGIDERIMMAMIRLYKLASTGYTDDPEPPIQWARSAYRGYPSVTPARGNRPNCPTNCPIPYQGARFDFIWEPHKPR